MHRLLFLHHVCHLFHYKNSYIYADFSRNLHPVLSVKIKKFDERSYLFTKFLKAFQTWHNPDGLVVGALNPSCIPWVPPNDLFIFVPSKKLKLWSFASENTNFSCVQAIPEIVDGIFPRTSSICTLGPTQQGLQRLSFVSIMQTKRLIRGCIWRKAPPLL